MLPHPATHEKGEEISRDIWGAHRAWHQFWLTRSLLFTSPVCPVYKPRQDLETSSPSLLYSFYISKVSYCIAQGSPEKQRKLFRYIQSPFMS